MITTTLPVVLKRIPELKMQICLRLRSDQRTNFSAKLEGNTQAVS